MAKLDESGYAGSPQIAEAIKNIRNGDTWYQHKRALQRKIGMAGIQAGLTGVRGALGYAESEKTQQEQRNKEIQAALKNAIRPPTAPPAQGQTDEYGLPTTSSLAPKMGDSSVGAGQGVNPSQSSFSPDGIKALAASLTDQGKTNEAAQAAPVGGVWNKPGFNQADMQAAVNGSDINRSKNLMNYGLMSSTYSEGGPGADDPMGQDEYEQRMRGF